MSHQKKVHFWEGFCVSFFSTSLLSCLQTTNFFLKKKNNYIGKKNNKHQQNKKHTKTSNNTKQFFCLLTWKTAWVRVGFFFLKKVTKESAHSHTDPSRSHSHTHPFSRPFATTVTISHILAHNFTRPDTHFHMHSNTHCSHSVSPFSDSDYCSYSHGFP